ncbi:hypothetical protein HPP92_004100 [Vanilla planifolia]|uniref:RBR-type E3 ubiquitin transferase n=1 Tax=Vanilla planifolia TaxID=51239 RepID=A0A835S7G2_VANPL|nr:hypothetical protein HPP92_004100 [Vanilla planifolia]
MDSEDDMHDAHDVESLDDDFYSGDTPMGSEDGDAEYDFVDNESEDSEDVTSHRQQEMSELARRMFGKEAVDGREDVGVAINSRKNLAAASTGPWWYDWIRDKVNELYIFVCGVFQYKPDNKITFRHAVRSVSRVHDEWFADEENVRKVVGLLEKPVEMPNARELQWEYNEVDKVRTYKNGTAISDGPGCLMLRCPDPSCGVAVGEDMIRMLASDEDKQKYSRYLLRSYIEDNRKTKWCPAPGCEFAVEFVMGSSSYDVTCNCSYSFCWNCTEEAHRPVDCATVAKWILKNCAESENMNWILANSKPCPKCYALVHGQSMGKEQSRQKALADLHSMQNEKAGLEMDLRIWLLSPRERVRKAAVLQYLQGEAEAGLERLHQCAEKELQVYLEAEAPTKDFNYFRTKLAGLTSVTRNYFENLVRALETGLRDVGPSGNQANANKNTSPKSLLGGKGGKSGKAKVIGTSSRSGGRSLDDGNHWSCEHCTYANPRSANVCQMCEQHRCFHGVIPGYCISATLGTLLVLDRGIRKGFMGRGLGSSSIVYFLCLSQQQGPTLHWDFDEVEKEELFATQNHNDRDGC